MRDLKQKVDRENIMDYTGIHLALASSDDIMSWSSGEITKPETINYRTYKPERDGLFCAKIFGPTQDFRCLCGKYKGMKYKGIICEKCGVEVTYSSVRRERMGHIKLHTKVAHIWFFKGVPTIIGIILGISAKKLEHIIYFENYLVTDPKDIPKLKGSQILTEEEYLELVEEYGEDSFEAGMGAEIIYKALREIDVEKEKESLRKELKKVKSIQKQRTISRKLRYFEDFFRSGNKLEWMILDVIPVLPPDLRPLVKLDGGRFASSDLNDLYRRVISRNNRLKRLIELKAPELIIRNEKRMLQESVDALFDNQKRNRSYMSSQNRPLKSLSDSLKGKQGRFRQNLLGKRVDYSGRSVIVVDPRLKLDECGLPQKMALELFKPFVYNKLEEKGLVTTLRVARTWVEEKREEVWEALDEVVKEHTVILNRAPTLHRLGIQSFKPILIDGKAISIHPMVCPAFNADFDGDQMAVHVPLSIEAQAESKVLMLSSKNILSPASGKPLTIPTQDMILGFYYLTFSKPGLRGENRIFSSKRDVLLALENHLVDLNARIYLRYSGPVKNLETYELDDQDIIHAPLIEYKGDKLLYTTPGRVLFNNELPDKTPFINGLLKKKGVEELIYFIYLFDGFEDTVKTLDHLKAIGFEYATKGGFTISISDLMVPEEKQKILDETTEEIEKIEKQYKAGRLTKGERHNNIIDKWSKSTTRISQLMFQHMKEHSYQSDEINPLFMMSDSGARGSKDQLKQLAGMRGLMAKPSGEILETPITANFKEGLSVLQYFISTHGARKGLADTALKTADAGYLTRKLVDSAVEIIVQEEDCGTLKGIEVSSIVINGTEIESLRDRIVGRVSLHDIENPDDPKDILVKANQEIDEMTSKRIEDLGIMTVQIRSPLTCEVRGGVCKKCYGRNLSTGRLIDLGEAVGVIAGQSIGEPGTQLTMRTFHTGGVASGAETQRSLNSSCEGIVKFENLLIVKDRNKDNICISRNGVIKIQDKKGRDRMVYPIAYGSLVYVEDGQQIREGHALVKWDPYVNSILTVEDGVVEMKDFKENISYVEDRDKRTGKITKIVVDIKNDKLRAKLEPRINIRDKKNGKLKKKYYIPVNAHIMVKDGDEIVAGDMLGKIPSEFSKTKDITGGLPRVTELFEARKPRKPAEMAQIDGIVRYGKMAKGSRKISIEPFDSKVKPQKHKIPRGAYIIVGDGEKVKAGQPLMDGPLNPKDILEALGEERLAMYLLQEIQEVYRMQGVAINDKHVEIIIRQMLKWRKVEDAGDTSLIAGQTIEKKELEEVNRQAVDEGGQPAKAKPVLLPISRAALAYDSFLSAAAFQETTKVLTSAAIAGKRDELKGIKENVTMGRLIPAGTGFNYYADQEADEGDDLDKLLSKVE